MADREVTAIDVRTERSKWTTNLGSHHGGPNLTTPRLLATETALFAACHARVAGDEDIHWFTSEKKDASLAARAGFGVDAGETLIISSLAGRRNRAVAGIVDQSADDDGRLDPTSVLMAVDRGFEDWRIETEYAIGHVTLGPERVFCATPHTAAGSYGPMVVEGFEIETGTRAWRRDLPSPARGTALAEGTLCLSLDDGIVALDASTGDLLWENYDISPISGPTIAGETLLVGRRDRSGDELCAIDTADGTERWSHELEIDVTGALAVVEDAILVDGQVCLVAGVDSDDREAADVDDGSETGREARLCPECTEPVSEDANFCSNCGANLRTDACPECGSDLDGGESFCPACGERLG